MRLCCNRAPMKRQSGAVYTVLPMGQLWGHKEQERGGRGGGGWGGEGQRGGLGMDAGGFQHNNDTQ